MRFQARYVNDPYCVAVSRSVTVQKARDPIASEKQKSLFGTLQNTVDVKKTPAVQV